MANTYADGDLVQAAILDRAYELALAERSSLIVHPALAAGYLGERSGTGSAAVNRVMASIGAGTMASVAETGTAATVDFTFANLSATAGRRSTGRSMSDMLGIFDATGLIRDPNTFVADAIQLRNNTLVDMVANVINGYTLTRGATTTDLTWATIRSAKNALIGNDVPTPPGSLLCVLHNQQWSDLETDLVTTSNEAEAITAEARQIQILANSGYKGRYFGIDFFTTNRTPTANAGADYAGGLFAPLGVAWNTANIIPQVGADGFILGGGDLQVEYKRTPEQMLSEVFYNAMIGVSKGDDDRGVTLISGVS